LGSNEHFIGLKKSKNFSGNLPRGRQLEVLKEKHPDLILVAGILYTKQREALRLRGINYLDATGNTFIRRGPLYFFIEGQTEERPKKEMGNRAFTATGLKVVMQLLMDKELINQPQRRIAEKADVALGNIPKVIAGLKDTGYLLPLNKKEYIWENRKELLDRWVEEYETTLAPKIRKGFYQLKGDDWRELQWTTEETVWGGEAAGELMTQYLRAEQLILYTQETRLNLMKNFRLIPDKKGRIEVREKFWQNEIKGLLAPPVLVYADLMITQNQRCLDTAQIIFDEHIQPKL
jgi:hypothetical protein